MTKQYEKQQTHSIKVINNVLNGLILIFIAASSFSISITQGALALALIAWLIQMLLKKEFSIQRTPLDYFFLAYLLLETIATVFSIDPAASLQNFKRIALIPIVYLIAENVRTEKFAKILVTALIAVMMVLSFYGIFKYLSGVGGIVGRLKLFHHYMTSGGILMMIGLINLSIVFSSASNKLKIYAILAGIPILLSLIFTFTRSSWLGFLAGLIIIGIFRNRKLMLILLVVAIFLFLLGPASIQERILSIFDPTHPTNVERINMWKAGIRIIQDYPLTGVGDIDLGEIYQQYKSPSAKENVGHLHNNFLQFGATLGIPGLIFIILLFGRIFIMNLAHYLRLPEEKWFLKAIALSSLAISVGFVINGLFEWNFGDAETVMIFWVSVGLSLAIVRIHEIQQMEQCSAS